MTMVQTSGQVNLSGAADDYTVAQKAVGLDATPQRAFGGDLQGVRIDLQGRDAELFQVRRPGLLVGEVRWEKRPHALKKNPPAIEAFFATIRRRGGRLFQ